MIAIALLLSDDGVGDYWDDADRWIRNMFAEGQLLSTDWIYHVPRWGSRTRGPSHSSLLRKTPTGRPTASPSETSVPSPLGPLPTTGTWATATGSRSAATVTAARTMYWIWDRALQYRDGELSVNLLLNRPSPWADVESHIPYTGRVDVKIKQALNLRVRLPDWASQQQTRCRLNDADRRVEWDGRYCKVGSVAPGDTVTLTFPSGSAPMSCTSRRTASRSSEGATTSCPSILQGASTRCTSANTTATASPGGAPPHGLSPTKSSPGNSPPSFPRRRESRNRDQRTPVPHPGPLARLYPT